MPTLAHINAVHAGDFVALLASVYEHSPWVPERAAPLRPFSSVDQLARALQEAVLDAEPDEQLALMYAHPELVGRVAPASLTTVSRAEQQAAGLNESTEAEVEELRAFNRVYRSQFGFPFVVAVRGLSRADIVARLILRSRNSRDEEFRNNLTEIGKIARLRLADLVNETA